MAIRSLAKLVADDCVEPLPLPPLPLFDLDEPFRTLTPLGIEYDFVAGDRGLDHGVFIPLKVWHRCIRCCLIASAGSALFHPPLSYDFRSALQLVFPDADVPVVQISLASSLDPEFHLALGAALAPLRAEGRPRA